MKFTLGIVQAQGGGVGIFGLVIFCLVFRFWCLLQFAVFPFLSVWFSVYGKNTFVFPIWYPMWFSIFPSCFPFFLQLLFQLVSTACARKELLT